MRSIIALLLLVLTLPGCLGRDAPPPPQLPPPPKLADRLSEILEKAPLQGAQTGVYVAKLGTGRPVYQHNGHDLFIPASTMKIFTTAALLMRAGPDFRYTTRLYAQGPVYSGALRGDLVVRGTGDPTVRSSSCQGDQSCLQTWAEAVAQTGIREIRGDLVADDSFFSGQDLGKGWSWDDLDRPWSAPSGALGVDGNSVLVRVSPGLKTGRPARVRIYPDGDFIRLDNRTTTRSRGHRTDLVITRLIGEDALIIRGSMPLGAKPAYRKLAVTDPTMLLLSAFRKALEDLGIRVRGTIRAGGTAAGQSDRLLAEFRSMPLSELIRMCNKDSENLTAEQFLRTLGALYSGVGSADRGAKAVTAWLFDIGVPYREFHMYDGSGLSRLNLVSPFAATEMLRYMADSPHAGVFADSLAVAGLDGTLEHRMVSGCAARNARGKTGTLTHESALSGYVTDRMGNRYAVSVMVNNSPYPSYRSKRLEDRIFEAVADWPPVPPAPSGNPSGHPSAAPMP